MFQAALSESLDSMVQLLQSDITNIDLLVIMFQAALSESQDSMVQLLQSNIPNIDL